jgi:prevent-host-death family protein
MCYMAHREQVGVREIRQNLSVYLERVKRGEALEITEHGRPVAVLAPLPKMGSLTARLVAEGRATAPTLSHRGLKPPVAPKTGDPNGPSISEILMEMREDRI